MTRHQVCRWFVALLVAASLLVVACAPSASPQAPAPQPQPAAQSVPPSAPPKPASDPAAKAPQPAKPATSSAPATSQVAKPVAQPIELRAGSGQPKGDPISDTVNRFAELVRETSQGELLVRNFDQALGSEQQLAQSVSTGSVDMGAMSSGNSARFTDAWLLYDLPFLFKSYGNTLKSLDGPIARSAIERFEKDLSVKYLFPISLGSGRDIQTRSKQLKAPADIKGLKIRVISSPVDLATFKAWGANPTPVDWSQTFVGLQQGVIDGTQITIGAFMSNKMYEVIKFNIRLDYQPVFEPFFMNAKRFASLSPRHQSALLEAAQQAKIWNQQDAAGRTEKIIQQMREHGVQVYVPTPAEYAQWASIREKVWQDVSEQLKGKIDLDVAKKLYESQ